MTVVYLETGYCDSTTTSFKYHFTTNHVITQTNYLIIKHLTIVCKQNHFKIQKSWLLTVKAAITAYLHFGLLSETREEEDKVCASRRLVTRQENSVLESVWSEYWRGTASGQLAFLSLKQDKVKTLHTNKETIPGIVKRWFNHTKKNHISEEHNQRATANTADAPILSKASGNSKCLLHHLAVKQQGNQICWQ